MGEGMPTPRKVVLAGKFAAFTETWAPRIVGELNGQHVKVARLDGAFVWHHHEHEDELFLVVRGHLTMHFRDRDVELDEGQLVVVPRGVEHRPEAHGECHVLLVEPGTTRRLGNLEGSETT